MNASGTLFVVGTPIGNLHDLTDRAREVLTNASFIMCEDTRVTAKLLQHLSVRVPLVSLHQHSDERKIQQAIDRILAGENAALVTDAGTPGIADPGGKVVAAAYEREVPVVAIPGPSALIAALSISGLPTDRFLFLGFLPHKKGRETLFRRIAETEETVVLYESPHRLLKTLNSLSGLSLNKTVVVCREITKIHESVVRGTADKVLEHFTSHPDQVRGEIVIVIGPG